MYVNASTVAKPRGEIGIQTPNLTLGPLLYVQYTTGIESVGFN